MVDLQLGQQPGLAVPRRTVPVPDVGGGHAEEAAAEGDADDVLAAPERLGDVVDGVQHGLVVVREAGLEDLPADPAAVDLGLVVGESADVEAGPGDPPPHGEGAAQQRRGLLRHGDAHSAAPGPLPVRGAETRQPGPVTSSYVPSSGLVSGPPSSVSTISRTSRPAGLADAPGRLVARAASTRDRFKPPLAGTCYVRVWRPTRCVTAAVGASRGAAAEPGQSPNTPSNRLLCRRNSSIGALLYGLRPSISSSVRASFELRSGSIRAQ